ncbi:MAG: Fpg/Nei family DNA glycosylase [Candidatus Izimaplasma sp.]|nr:Fpg/Nei family DNA glycosylase [Candidatus Izimaplasma bacterium]
MPELPEIYVLSEQLDETIKHLTIKRIVIHQEKSVNISKKSFNKQIKNSKITHVTSKGKWLIISLDTNASIRVNLGMGGNLRYTNSLPDKSYQAHITFKNNMHLSFDFWWFGSVHLVEKESKHKPTDTLGLDPIRDKITLNQFKELLDNRRGSLKNFLLNQKRISGIGNYYIHDILFKAHIHPHKKIPDLTSKQTEALFHHLINEFEEAINLNGSDYEQDIFGNYGKFKANQIAYNTGEPCPICQTSIKKIKTGATSSYVCETCQH